MKKIIITTTAIALLFAACKTTKSTDKKDAVVTSPAVDCSAMPVTYLTDIKPILEQHCNRCHGRAGGYNFSIMADITRAVKKGELLGTIKWQHGFPKMPISAPQLDAATISKVECWINNGMK
jgi:hypothetical protein